MSLLRLTNIADLDPDKPVLSIEGGQKPPFRAPQGKVWVDVPPASMAAAEKSTATRSMESLTKGSTAVSTDVLKKSDRSFTARDDRSNNRGM